MMPLPVSSPAYKYRPVDLEHRGFRVAILQPATDHSAPLCCELAEVVLDNHNHPDYEAISYVWGDPNDRALLRVEDAEFSVTANLALALRYLRLPHEPRTLWADAICIDQNNIDERSRQVQLMKEIYSSCVRDLVWLGESNESTQSGIDGLMHMKSLNLQRLTDQGYKDFNNGAALSELGIEEPSAIDQLIASPSLWERVWVMQEIACCPEAMLVIGKFTMPWTILSSILDHSGVPDRYHLPFSHQRFEQYIWDTFAKTQVIEHQRDIVKGTSSVNSTLLDVLSRFRATHSTDPRDKIYGLLGLATDNHGIIPDYRKSIQEVYIEVARLQLNATRSLDLITQSLWPLGNTPVPDFSSYHRYSKAPALRPTVDLPSWVPNFSATNTTKILFAQRSIFAAGTPTFASSPTISLTGVLTLTATVLGKVATLKPVRERSYSAWRSFSPWARDWLPDSLTGDKGAAPSYPAGGDSFAAYWRTLMTDCVAFPSRRLSADEILEYGSLFERWREKITALPLFSADGHPDNGDDNQKLLDEMDRMARRTGVITLLAQWRFAELEGGLYAMVPWAASEKGPGNEAEVGDVVVVVEGGKVPLVLRPKTVGDGEEDGGGTKRWEIVGTAYVHGFMDGLAAEWTGDGRLEERIFDIV